MNPPSGALVSSTADGSFSLSSGSEDRWSRGFVAGPENAVLLGAIDDFCASADTLYNPLVLHGPPGIGKTHIARDIVARQDAASATGRPGGNLYFTGSDWALHYANAVESRSLSTWRETVRAAQLLVIDGLDALAGKHAAQIELLHSCDELLHAGQRILVTARQEPALAGGLLPGLVSRLTAGLAVRIAPPGAAARRAVIERFAHDRQLAIDVAAIDLLANELEVTVPELRGALHELRIVTCETTTAAGPVDRTAVRALLERRRAQQAPTLRDIAGETARHFGITLAELRGASRRQNVAKARGVAMHLARQLTGKSLGAVGGYFGGRDHTTVMYACRKTEELIASDATIRSAVAQLHAALVES